LLLIILLVAILLHVAIGSSLWIPLDRLLTELLKGSLSAEGGNPENRIIWALRVPRALGCACIGIILGSVGSSFQSLFRNPLAEPYILGVSSGAAVGGTLALWAGISSFFWGIGTVVVAFLAGLASLALVLALARRNGAISIPTTLLAGVVLSSVLSGVLTWVLAASGGDTNRLVQWLLGSTANIGWERVAVVSFGAVVGVFLLLMQSRRLNALAMGEEAAARLGIDVRKVTRNVLLVGTGMAAVAVGSAGIIGFVGLVSPHIARNWFGVDLRQSLLASALLGGVVLLIADIVAQRAVPHTEVPIGAVTAILGAPVLLTILKRRS